MTWLRFVILYALSITTLGMVLHHFRILRLDSTPLLRAITVASGLLLLGELIAEERGLWIIPAHSGKLLFKTPFETIILVATTSINSLQIYALSDLFLKQLGRLSTWRECKKIQGEK